MYAEVSWTPFRYIRQGLQFNDVMGVMNDQLERRGMRSRVGFIIDSQRDHGLDVGQLVYRTAFACEDMRIVGVGLTGFERGFSPVAFGQLYSEARDHGLGCTAHAGEYGPPEDIWSTVLNLGVTRIGHGVQAHHDDALLDYLAEHQVHLEVCPTSNVRLQRVTDLAAHPVGEFLARGINFGINSDDPALFGHELTEEYIAIVQETMLTTQDIELSIGRSIDAAFATPDQKMALHERLQNSKEG